MIGYAVATLAVAFVPGDPSGGNLRGDCFNATRAPVGNAANDHICRLEDR